MAISQWWNEGKLRDALALGYPNLVPAFAKGKVPEVLQLDYHPAGTSSRTEDSIGQRWRQSRRSASCFELATPLPRTFVVYAAANTAGAAIAMDGSHLTTTVGSRSAAHMSTANVA